MKVQNLRDPLMKNLLCIALLLFAFLFASVSAASASEIVLDTEHHHLGDNFKEELTPADPDGLVYTATFTLDPLADIRYTEFTVAVKSVVPGPTDEFLDKVYLNEIEIGALNDYIPENTADSAAVDILIPVHPTFFNPGNNTIKISAGSNADGSNYDDFEFYNLSLHLSETEPVTLEPPLKVVWTYKLPGEFDIWEITTRVFAADGVLYLYDPYEHFFYYPYGLIALDAETGEVLLSKERCEYLGYKDGVLFYQNSSYNIEPMDAKTAELPGHKDEVLFYKNFSHYIEALDVKTGELLWCKEYHEWDASTIFGNTLFGSIYHDSLWHVAAINAGNGNLEWEHEFDYEVSNPVVSGNFVISRSNSDLIALDAKTGKEVWKYTNLDYISTPFICKDLVYVVAQGDIVALSVESGEEVWRTKAGNGANILEVKNNTLLVDSDNPVLLNAGTGEIMKDNYSEVPVSHSGITDKYIYSTPGCKIQVYNSSTGEPVWSSSRIKSNLVSRPTLYKDKLYLVSSEGKLYAFEHGEEGIFFTKGLENSATLYFFPAAVVAMLVLLAILQRKIKSKALIFVSWVLAFEGILYLIIFATDPYTGSWNASMIKGVLVFMGFWSLPVILLLGIVFLVYDHWKRRK